MPESGQGKEKDPTKVEFFRHSLGEAEFRSLTRALEGVFLTAGPLTSEFEERLARFLGCRRVVGTWSCTSALFLVLKALGIGRHDEVITTPMTFIATPNAILEAGATPVFVDVEETTANMDADLVEEAIGPRTRAIMPVHLYGHMCDMKRLRKLADRHGLLLIEDAAHCLEGERDGIRPAQVSEAACFSFYATKNITSGEGGAIATNDPDLAERLMLLRSHGMNREAAGRYSQTYRHWDMLSMGYKANMFDIQAALLLPQIPGIKENLEKRRGIYNSYREAFGDLEGIGLPGILAGTVHAHNLFTLWVDPALRDGFLERLQEQGIGVAVNYRAVHLLTYYRRRFGFREGMFPRAETIGRSTLSIPLYPRLSSGEVKRVIKAVKQVAGTFTPQPDSSLSSNGA